MARLRGALGGKPRARRWALVSTTVVALTVAATARAAKAVANFIVTVVQGSNERRVCEEDGGTNGMERRKEALGDASLVKAYVFSR